jgi:peptide methionine sulfoxide reductase msrA/msrB
LDKDATPGASAVILKHAFREAQDAKLSEASFVDLIVLILDVAYQLSDAKNPEENGNMVKNDSKLQVATFAGGCFWCIEADFEKVPGVVKVISGYTGGDQVDPTYEEVSSGRTNHLEAVQVYYDPFTVAYEELLDIFWRHIDPTDEGGQFVDRGSQYCTAIFYHNEEQKGSAQRSKKDLAASGRFDKPKSENSRPFTRPRPITRITTKTTL